MISLASTGAQSCAKFKKMANNAVFHVSDPKKGAKNKNLQNSYTTFFLNHTKMTLTNFQWISTKIEDLHKQFVEISNCNFFCENGQF